MSGSIETRVNMQRRTKKRAVKKLRDGHWRTWIPGRYVHRKRRKSLERCGQLGMGEQDNRELLHRGETRKTNPRRTRKPGGVVK